MADQHAGGITPERRVTGTALKRRGILGAAGAAVAGIMAKMAAQPVAAAGSLTLEIPNTVTSGTTTILVAPTFQNTVFEVDATASTANVLYIDAIRGRGQFTGAGVHGYGGDAKTNTGAGIGVQGTGGNGGTVPGGAFKDGGKGAYAYGGSGGIGGEGVYAHGGGAGAAALRGGYGVYAEAGSGAATSAVYAINRFQSSAGHAGVTGVCTSTGGIGVQGQGTGAGVYGVYGQSDLAGGCGVRGDCIGGTGVLGSVSDGYGVLGQADTGNGLRGYANQNHAVVGQTGRAYYGGVFGVATLDNTVGIYGSTKGGAGYNGNAFAGYMDGNFVVANGFKSAAVKHADGTHRLVYCVESPESWLEDFGKAKLVGGKAEVKLDADFAAIAEMTDYMVFLTPEGDSRGLYITAKTATGFTVREQQAGTSSLTFSYRVVAKRKDIAAARLAKFDLVGKAKHDATPPRAPEPPKLPKLPEKS